MVLKVRQISACIFFRTQEALKLKLKQQSAREEGICQVMYIQKTNNAMTRDNDILSVLILIFLKLEGLSQLFFLLQCTMLSLSTKSCLKSSKLRPISNGQFCHAISKNICLNLFGSKQPGEILVFVIFKL